MKLVRIIAKQSSTLKIINNLQYKVLLSYHNSITSQTFLNNFFQKKIVTSIFFVKLLPLCLFKMSIQ